MEVCGQDAALPRMFEVKYISEESWPGLRDLITWNVYSECVRKIGRAIQSGVNELYCKMTFSSKQIIE